MSGFVYAFHPEGKPDGVFKIGRTTQPGRRLSQHRSNFPGVEYDVLVEVEGDSRDVERAVHAHFAEQRISGEWFRDLEPAVIAAAINQHTNAVPSEEAEMFRRRKEAAVAAVHRLNVEYTAACGKCGADAPPIPPREYTADELKAKSIPREKGDGFMVEKPWPPADSRDYFHPDHGASWPLCDTCREDGRPGTMLYRLVPNYLAACRALDLDPLTGSHVKALAQLTAPRPSDGNPFPEPQFVLLPYANHKGVSREAAGRAPYAFLTETVPTLRRAYFSLAFQLMSKPPVKAEPQRVPAPSGLFCHCCGVSSAPAGSDQAAAFKTVGRNQVRCWKCAPHFVDAGEQRNALGNGFDLALADYMREQGTGVRSDKHPGLFAHSGFVASAPGDGVRFRGLDRHALYADLTKDTATRNVPGRFMKASA